MKKYLRCHTEGLFSKVGERYEIAGEDERSYHVKGCGYYTKEPDAEGLSYRNWFTLEFVPDISADITVLADESLGGIEREHREVKRKAAVGETVKSRVDNPPIFEVTKINEIQNGSVSGGADGIPTAPGNYVVLEPTDIIRIDDSDGVNRGYRMVDRKATVGERIIIVKATCVDAHEYTNGDIGIVTVAGWPRVGAVDAKINGTEYHVWREEYRVLEPVESAKPLSAQPPLDQAAANISALTAKVQALESRVATLEAANQPVKVAEGPADDAPPSFTAPPKPPQQLRDEIVERAKADVKALLDRNYYAGYSPSIWFARKHGVTVTDKCDFIINRDKRTVVALISVISGGKPFRKGIAKCAPNDVFNAHIGRAIALRRALGLEVPAEYLNVPNPEEPRVGDELLWNDGTRFRLTGIDGISYEFYSHQSKTVIGSVSYPKGISKYCKIIDDSREEVGA